MKLKRFWTKRRNKEVHRSLLAKSIVMKEFILLFRANYQDIAKVSVAETRERNNRWMDWINDLVDQNHLAEGGNHLTSKGKIIRSNGEISVESIPENKGSILGYILILASSLNEAIELAKGCPILAGKGTSVEVREISNN